MKSIFLTLCLLFISIYGFSQNSYQNYENCQATINTKYEKLRNNLESKYYRRIKLKENYVAGAWPCYTGERVCLKHNNNHCCKCEEDRASEYEQLIHQQGIELETCQKRYQEESQYEEKLQQEKEKKEADKKEADKKEQDKKEQERRGEQQRLANEQNKKEAARKEQENVHGQRDDVKNKSNEKGERKNQKSIEEEVHEQKMRYQQSRMNWHAEQREIQGEQTTKAAQNAALGIAGATGMIGNIQNKLSDKNFYTGASSHLGVSLGIVSPNTPIVVNTFNANNSYSAITTPFQAGILLGLDSHPVITDNLAWRIKGSFVAALDPIGWLSGDGTSTTSSTVANMDISNTTGGSTTNYDFGSELAGGSERIKVLGGYYFKHYLKTYQSNTTADTYVGDNTVTMNSSDIGSVDFSANRMEFGLRLGENSGTMIDFIYGMERFKDEDGTTQKFPVYKINVWKFSGFRYFVEYAQGIAYGQNILAWRKESDANKKGLYLNLGVSYSIDWLWKW